MRGPFGGSMFYRRPFATRLSVGSFLAAPTTASLVVRGSSVPRATASYLSVLRGRTALLPYRPPFVPHFPVGTSTLAAALQLHRPLSLRRTRWGSPVSAGFIEAVDGILPMLFLPGSALGSFVSHFGIQPT